MDNYQQFIATSRYCRWIESEKRRETWEEAVNRYTTFMFNHIKSKCNFDLTTLKFDLQAEIANAIINLEVLPSMRCMMMAGPALERCNVGAYNCAYLTVDNPRAFDECMYILMCGTGVGFSVERQYISKLPEVNEHFEETATTIIVEDTRAGWAKGLRELISLLYSGRVPSWDLSKLRPAGSRLKTSGGRSSGPEPLASLYLYIVSMFRKAAGRKLTSLECHDIMCKIGEVVVVGGVRRSAMISLSNLSDDRMRAAKTGDWYTINPQRTLSNNSACYSERPELAVFMREWLSLYESKSGERGIFNREASKLIAARNGRRNTDHDFGTNPCSEIILRPFQFCNLTEIVVRYEDDEASLMRKVRIGTIIGTLQSTLTDFKYLRKVWQRNTEEERLLGVSLTGILDNIRLVKNTELQGQLRQLAININEEWAQLLKIPQSTAITCVKPSGTVSQLVNSASGIHPRYAKYYVRRVRGDNKDPMTTFMKGVGIPFEPEIHKPNDVTVFSFPQKAPRNAITRKDLTAVEHLEIWKRFQLHWCEHKPSITINVKESEWLQVQSWVWDNFDIVSGIAFLPEDDHIYQQAPYEEITKEQYDELSALMPNVIDWNELSQFEQVDMTTGVQDLACSGNMCELVDLVAK